MIALSLLTEEAIMEAAESRSLKINTNMLLVEVWAQNSLYQFSPFIPHPAERLDYRSDFFGIFIMECGLKIAGTMSDKVLALLDEEKLYNSARVDGLLFVGGEAAESSNNWLDSSCFLGVCGP
jgi:hypothetical protein